jgi:hypothetical protein
MSSDRSLYETRPRSGCLRVLTIGLTFVVGVAVPWLAVWLVLR